MCVDKELHEFKIRLYNNRNRMRYNAPVSGSLGAIVYDSGPRSQNDFDIIIHIKDGGVHDALLKGDSDGHDVRKRIILPASSTDGPRYMYKHYEDALAICRVHGNPQYFMISPKIS
nr:putative DNA helicase [Tanacetum cinerariifolium]